MTEADGTITLDVTVTNTGSVAGKDAVQVYFNPPYTDGGIEKASANLVTFGKTDSIEPGASQTLTLTFNTEDMASFDSKDKGCYVLEEGRLYHQHQRGFPHGAGFQDLQCRFHHRL